jgi:hypothetical protein
MISMLIRYKVKVRTIPAPFLISVQPIPGAFPRSDDEDISKGGDVADDESL